MFSERIEEALKLNKITGNKLCNKLKIDNKNYTNWKKNIIPRGETLKQIADILNVSVDWLLERDNSMNPEETNLISNYRKTDEKGKQIIKNIAKELAQEQQLLISSNGEKIKNEA